MTPRRVCATRRWPWQPSQIASLEGERQPGCDGKILPRASGLNPQSLSASSPGRSVPSTAWPCAWRASSGAGSRTCSGWTGARPVAVEMADDTAGASRQPPPSAARAKSAPHDARVVLASIEGRWVAHRLGPATRARWSRPPTARSRVAARETAAQRARHAARRSRGRARYAALRRLRAGRRAESSPRAPTRAAPAGASSGWSARAAPPSTCSPAARSTSRARTSTTRRRASSTCRSSSADCRDVRCWCSTSRAGRPGWSSRPATRGASAAFAISRVRTSVRARQPGAAAQDLVERLLRRRRTVRRRRDAGDAGRRPRPHGRRASGRAAASSDAGVALPEAARAHGLEFIPLAEERFDRSSPRNTRGTSASCGCSRLLARRELPPRDRDAWRTA